MRKLLGLSEGSKTLDGKNVLLKYKKMEIGEIRVKCRLEKIPTYKYYYKEVQYVNTIIEKPHLTNNIVAS